MPSFCDKPREAWFSGTPANLAASSVTRARAPPGGGATCLRRFIPMPLPLNWSGAFCSGESEPSSRQSCLCRNSFPELAIGWWMKSFGGLESTRQNEQATYPLPSKRTFGNKPDSLPTAPLKRSGREGAIHLRVGCFTYVGKTGEIVLNQANLSYARPWPGEPLVGVLLCSA